MSNNVATKREATLFWIFIASMFISLAFSMVKLSMTIVVGVMLYGIWVRRKSLVCNFTNHNWGPRTRTEIIEVTVEQAGTRKKVKVRLEETCKNCGLKHVVTTGK